MDISIRELECFMAVTEELSFTRAARRLRLAQPALSRHIRALEEKIGAALFARNARSVAITAGGRMFHEEARDLLPQLARAGEAAARAAAGETARLRLGFVSAVLGAELAALLRKFRHGHSSTEILLHDLSPAEQIRLIREGRLDGGFIGLAPEKPTDGMALTPWRRERLRVFLPTGHPLAQRTRLAVAALRKEAFVAVSHAAAPAFAQRVRALCRKAGFRPRIILESPRAQAVALMVAAGSGVAILPESLADFTGAPTAGLTGHPEIVHVFARAAGPPSPALRDFLSSLALGRVPADGRAQ